MNDRDKAMLALEQREDILAKADLERRDLTRAERVEVRQLETNAKALITAHDAKMDELRANSAHIIVSPEHRTAAGQTDGFRTWLPGLHEYRELQGEQRAVGTSGAFIPVAGASQYFDLLRPRVSVLAATPNVLPVEGYGSIRVPKVTSAISVGVTPENTAISPSDPGLSDLLLDPTKIAAYTLVAREAVEDSTPQVRDVVARSLVADAAVALDKQFLLGTGTGGQMLGLRNTPGATSGPSLGSNGGQITFGLLSDTVAAAEAANTDSTRLAFFMAPRVWNSVRKLVDSQGRPIVSLDPTAGTKPSIFGIPVHVSNNLPVTETQGTSTDCSSILLADMSQVVVAQARAIELSMSEHIGFQSDQIALRVTARYAIGVPQPTALTITSGIRP